MTAKVEYLLIAIYLPENSLFCSMLYDSASDENENNSYLVYVNRVSTLATKTS